MPAANTTAMNKWNKFPVIQLQTLLGNSGLSCNGTKTELVNRLIENNIDNTKVDPMKPMVLGGKFNFGYNLYHSMRMVIVKQVGDNILVSDDFVKWCKEAKWYKIHKDTENKTCEAVLYFKTIKTGNEAHIALKSFEDHNVTVTHPNFEAWGCHPPQYCDLVRLFLSEGEVKKGKMLPLFTSLLVNPLTYDEMVAPRKKHLDKRKHVVLENVPDAITDEDLLKDVPEAKETIVFNYDPECAGIALLEFEDEDSAEKYLAKKKHLFIKTKKCPASLYIKRLRQWQEEFCKAEKNFIKKPNVESELTDEERVLKCEIWHVIQNDKKELLNRTDLTALEKMQEHVRLHEEQRPIKSLVGSDTKRRLESHLEIHDDPTLEIKSVTQVVKVTKGAVNTEVPVIRIPVKRYISGKCSEEDKKRSKPDKPKKTPVEPPPNSFSSECPTYKATFKAFGYQTSAYTNDSAPITLDDFAPKPNFFINPMASVIDPQGQVAQLMRAHGVDPMTLQKLPTSQNPGANGQAGTTTGTNASTDPLDRLDAFRAGISYQPKQPEDVEPDANAVPSSVEDRMDAFRRGKF